MQADLQRVQTAPARPRATISERRELVRSILQQNRDATGPAVHKAMLAAGHAVSERTAYIDRDAVLASMG